MSVEPCDNVPTAPLPPGCLGETMLTSTNNNEGENAPTKSAQRRVSTPGIFTTSRSATRASLHNVPLKRPHTAAGYAMVHSQSHPPNIPFAPTVSSTNKGIVTRRSATVGEERATTVVVSTSSATTATLVASARGGQVTTVDERTNVSLTPLARPISATIIGATTPVVDVESIDAPPASAPAAPVADWASSLARMAQQGARRSYSVTSTGSSLSGDICRICHCEATQECPLLTPCHCSGTLRYVHQHCLQQWIKSSQTKCCEVCRYNFIMHARTKPICKWKALDMTRVERRRLICSLSFHILALACVIWSEYILIDKTVADVHEGNMGWEFWTKLVVIIVGVAGGVVFMLLQCRSYCRLCNRWKNYNKNCPDVKPPPPPPPKGLPNSSKGKPKSSKSRIAAAS